MNLHQIVAGAIGTVNPQIPVTVRISVGQGPTDPDGTRPPLYATPGAFTGSIAADVLTVTAIASGVLQPWQQLSGAGLAAGTFISSQLTGNPGDVGTYRVSPPQTVTSEDMTTALIVLGQVQPTTWRDIQTLDGLNVSGVRWKIYMNGELNGLVRTERLGGDLIDIPYGPHAGTWLVAQVMESWPNWTLAAITLQNGS